MLATLGEVQFPTEMRVVVGYGAYVASGGAKLERWVRVPENKLSGVRICCRSLGAQSIDRQLGRVAASAPV